MYLTALNPRERVTILHLYLLITLITALIGPALHVPRRCPFSLRPVDVFDELLDGIYDLKCPSPQLMSTSNHPIIFLSDSDIEDAFFSIHSPDYTLASPNYFPASPGNTSPDPSDDLSNNESPIPPPQAPIAPLTILPPSLVLPLSPMFDPQDFFLPEEILPPQKQARFLSSCSDFSTPS
ncbi:hypothetical protein Tco_0930189 [Tanacetum coccineum]